MPLQAARLSFYLTLKQPTSQLKVDKESKLRFKITSSSINPVIHADTILSTKFSFVRWMIVNGSSCLVGFRLIALIEFLASHQVQGVTTGSSG